MSEELGLHVKLEADAGEFSAALSASAKALANLKVQTEDLKKGEKEIRSALESTSKSYELQSNKIKELKRTLSEKTTALENAKKKYGENSTQVKNLQQAISDLNQAIKTNTKNFEANEKQIERLNNDLVDNLKGQIDIKNEVKYVNSAIAKQTQEFQKNATQAENTTSATGKLRDGFNTLKAIALGYAGKTLFEALIGGNAEFEQYMTSFDVLMGSAEKAESMILEIERFAADTPLQMDDVAQATELLLSYGVAQEDVMTRLQQLGDVSKGNAEKMQRVTLAYGQMVAKGKVSGEELRQMTEAGVPLMNALAESMGVTTAQLSKLIEKGQVGIPELNKALESMTSEGGQFFGMMEKQGQTMSGLWSTLMDNINIFAREAGEESFEYLKSELSDLMNTMNQMAADGSLSAMARSIGDDIAAAVKMVVEFVKILVDMKEAIMLVGAAWGASKIGAGIQSVVGVFKTLNTVLSTVKDKQQMLNVLKGKTIVLQNQETGAITLTTAAEIKETAATKANTTAKKENANAQKQLNLALLKNPWTWVAAVIGFTVGAISMWNQKQEEAREKAIEQGETAAETNDKLLELNARYDELAEKNHLTSEEAAEFDSVEKDLIDTLGTKADALEGLKKGTEEYTEALRNATKEELENQRATLASARIAAGEKVEKDARPWLTGKLRVFAYPTSGKNYDLIKTELGQYEKEEGVFEAPEDPDEVVQFYGDLGEALEKLNTEYSELIEQGKEAEAQTLIESGTYNSLKNAIDTLKGSVDAYIKSKVNEAELEYILKNGRPNTVEDYNAMKEAVFGLTGAHESFKDEIYSILDGAFPQFSGKTEEAKGNVDDLGTSINNLNTSLDASAKKISDLSTIIDEYNKNGNLSAETVRKMLSEHPEYVKYLTKEGDQYKLNQAALDDLGKMQETQSKAMDVYIEKLKGQEFGTRDFANSFTEFAKALSEMEGYEDSELLKSFASDVEQINTQFVDGETTVVEYFDALQEKIKDVDFTAVQMGSDSMEGMFTGLTLATANGIEYLTKQFQSGQIDVQTYSNSIGEANENLLDLYTKANNLTYVNGQWLNAGGMVDEYAQSLQGAQDQLDAFNPILETITGNADYLKENLNGIGQAAFDAADESSVAFKSLAKSFETNLESMYTTNRSAYDKIVADTAESIGTTVDDITDGNGQIADGVYNNSVALNAGINSSISQLGQAINNVSQAAGDVITALGDMISNFDYTITFHAPEISDGEFDLQKYFESGFKEGIALPNIKWKISGEGGESVKEFGKSLKSFGNSISTVDFGGMVVGDLFERDTRTANPTGPTTSSGSSRGSSSKNSPLENWKKERDEIEKEDKAWNDDQKKRELISQQDYLYNLGERAKRYKRYAEEVLSLSYGTEAERQEIHKEYLEAAREADLDYLEFYIDLCEEEAKAKQELGGRDNFEAAAEELEKGKKLVQEYYEQGILSAQEYEQAIKNVEKEIKNARKVAYEERYQESMQWIEDRNFYNDWKDGDNEIEAYRRIIKYTYEAYDAGLFSSPYEFAERMSDIEKDLYTVQKETYEQMLQENYDAEKEAIEERLELRRKELEETKEMIREEADAEIAAIDEVLQKRKEEKEDSDDNLKLQRLKNKLEYENDEDNRRALQKEIDQLEGDIEDKMFEREMEAKKEQIRAEEEAKLEAIENTIAHETELAEEKIDYLTEMFELKMENINAATILRQSMNIDDYVNVGKEMGNGIAEGIRTALKEGIGNLVNNVVANATANIRASASGNSVVTNNNNTNNTKNFTVTQNFSGGGTPSPATQSASLKKLANDLKLKLEMM